jgi:hypothetical protein
METRMQRRWRDPKYQAWYREYSKSAAAKETAHRKYIRRREKMNEAELMEYRRIHNAEVRAFHKRHPEKQCDYDLRRHYGITLEEFKALLEKQQNKCALCGRPLDLSSPRRPIVDHDHKTEKVRGILHNRCNVLIGMAEENPTILEAAIRYLSL